MNNEEEKEETPGPLTGPEAHALVAYAISLCPSGAVDWLGCMMTPAGPVVVAVSGERPTDFEFVTDHVADAVNWLVEQDAAAPDREGMSMLSKSLGELVLAGREWESRAAGLDLGEVDDANSWCLDLDALRRTLEGILETGTKMATSAKLIAESFGVDVVPNVPDGQESLPLGTPPGYELGPEGQCPICGMIDCRCHEDVF